MASSTRTDFTADIDIQDRAEVTPSPEAEAQRAATLQQLREANATDSQEIFADLEAKGHVVRDDDRPVDELLDAESDSLDAEVDLSDEDESFHDGFDGESSTFDAAITPTVVDRPEQEFNQNGIPFEIVVRNGECNFERPTWFRFRGATKFGRDAVEDTNRRFEVFSRIAEWLNKRRQEFLRTGDPWLLGCEALQELRERHASVRPKDFLEITGIAELAGGSLFSRNSKGAVLSWEDGELSLDFLFGREARMAWVANAVRQSAVQLGASIQDLLEKYKTVTRPKESSKRRDLARSELKHLDWADLIGQANSLADTKWADVLERYRERMVKS